MSKVSGFTLIAGGLAIALYGLASGIETSDGAPAVQAGIVKTSGDDMRADRAVAVGSRLSTPAAASGPAFSAPVVVTIAPRTSEPSGALSQKAVFVPKDRDSLARELQKELRRVGCYEGELNGAWTPTTKRAMKAYLDRVNATLPVEVPDYILFSLVQGQQDQVCGKACPAGQGLSEDGLCLPHPILAKAAKKGSSLAGLPKAERPSPAVVGWSTTTTVVASAQPTLATGSAAPPGATAALPEGRMALAGPPIPPAALQPSPIRAVPGPAPPARRAHAPPPPRVTQAPPRGDNWTRTVFNQVRP
jgi:hypothetical protein